MKKKSCLISLMAFCFLATSNFSQAGFEVTDLKELASNPLKQYGRTIDFKDTWESMDTSKPTKVGEQSCFLVHCTQVAFYAPLEMKAVLSKISKGEKIAVSASIVGLNGKYVVVACSVTSEKTNEKVEVDLIKSISKRKNLPVKFQIYGFGHQFKWEEIDEGETFVKEDGTLYGLGADIFLPMDARTALRAKLELFRGDVDYEGGVQNLITGESTSLNDTTEYEGSKFEGSFEYNMSQITSLTLAPMAGAGIRTWTRTLGKDSDYGYDEDWQTFYALAGGNGAFKINTRTDAFASFQIRFPLANQEDIDMGPVFSIEPGKELSVYAEAGCRYRGVMISAFYETLRFSKSNKETQTIRIGNLVGDLSVYQPESNADMYGVKVGFEF